MDYVALKTLIEGRQDWAAFAASGDDQAIADACNALSETRIPVSEMTRAEFVAQFAPALIRVPSLNDATRRKWEWYRDMLTQANTVVLSAADMQFILSEIAADLIPPALAWMEAAGVMPADLSALPAENRPAAFLSFMASRAATVAEAAGVFGDYHYVMPAMVSHMDVYRALGRGVNAS